MSDSLGGGLGASLSPNADAGSGMTSHATAARLPIGPGHRPRSNSRAADSLSGGPSRPTTSQGSINATDSSIHTSSTSIVYPSLTKSSQSSPSKSNPPYASTPIKFNPKTAFAHPSTFATPVGSPPAGSSLLGNASSTLSPTSPGLLRPASSHAPGITPPSSFYRSVAPRRTSSASGSAPSNRAGTLASPSSVGRPPSGSVSSGTSKLSLPIGRVVPNSPVDSKSQLSTTPKSSTLPPPDGSIVPTTPTTPTMSSANHNSHLSLGIAKTPSARPMHSREPLISSTSPQNTTGESSRYGGGFRESFDKAWKKKPMLAGSDRSSVRDSMDDGGNESGYDSVVRRSVDGEAIGKSGAVIIEMGPVSTEQPAASPNREEQNAPKSRPFVDDLDGELGTRPPRRLSAHRKSKDDSEFDDDEEEIIGVDLSIHGSRSPSHRMPRTPQSRHAHFGPLPHSRPPSASTKSSLFTHRRAQVAEPRYMVPVLSGETSKPMRNYSQLPSKNRWLLRGHILLGGDSPLPFLGALAIVLGVAGVWFSTTCVWWWRRGHGGAAIAGVGAYMCLLTIMSMLMTAMRDPGILPRDLDPDPPYPPTTSATSDSNPPVPLPRDLRVRSGTVRVKYCVTCKTYRPPRASHCKMCDNCVDGCDHHCQWVNNCIGRRNYAYFITFVVTASLTALLILVTAILHIYLLTRDNSLNLRNALKAAPGSVAAVGMCLVVLWPLLALTGYHVRLLFLNITTIEQVRNQAHKKLTKQSLPNNPFALGKWHYNLAYLLCRPAGYSWVNPPGLAMQDTRKINPGFIVTRVEEGARRESENRTSSAGGDVEAGNWKK